MTGIWRVGVFPDEIWIVPHFGSAIPAGAELLSPGDAAWQVDAWFPPGAIDRIALAEIVDELGGSFAPRRLADAARDRALVRKALRAGWLRAYRVKEELAGGGREAAVEAPPERAAPTEKKTWVVIELMDEADPSKPVPFKKYRIELPDSTVREGLLDANGQARFSDIDPGTCKVSFPEIHAEEWRPA